jgi:hypothetical protein
MVKLRTGNSVDLAPYIKHITADEIIINTYRFINAQCQENDQHTYHSLGQ